MYLQSIHLTRLLSRLITVKSMQSEWRTTELFSAECGAPLNSSRVASANLVLYPTIIPVRKLQSTKIALDCSLAFLIYISPEIKMCLSKLSKISLVTCHWNSLTFWGISCSAFPWFNECGDWKCWRGKILDVSGPRPLLGRVLRTIFPE